MTISGRQWQTKHYSTKHKTPRTIRVIITEEGLVEASKRELLLNWYDAKNLTIGKCTDVLMGNQKSQQKACDLFFSLQKEQTSGQKTVDFEAKSVKHRNKICFEILDAISKRRGIEAFALRNAKKVILEELKHKNQVIVKLENINQGNPMQKKREL